MPLYLTNNRDIHIAQEWIIQLHRWIARHGLCGYDPFDIKAHPFFRALQTRPLLRKSSTALSDCFPLLSRRLLRIQPALNPKALALTAHGDLRLYQVTGDTIHLDRGLRHLDELRRLAVPDYEGLCWGYPFPIRATGLDCPINTPVSVIGAIAGEAFLLAHRLCGDEALLDAAQGISHFFLESLPRLPGDKDTWCFAYTPADQRRVHNANLLTVSHLLHTASRIKDRDLMEQLRPALEFSLSAQREDGAWPYGVSVAGDGYEPALMELVDHHHSGFVLRALYTLYKIHPSEELSDSLKRGYSFYRKLFRADGMPVNGWGAWPVDIHSCAEGILCNSALAEFRPGALNAAVQTLRWTHYQLRSNSDGAPWYRAYPCFRSRIVFPRWGVAWIYRALAEYLYAHRRYRRRGGSQFQTCVQRGI